MLLGSASDEAAARRDEWSDHDFFALVEAGRGAEVRPDLDVAARPGRTRADGARGRDRLRGGVRRRARVRVRASRRPASSPVLSRATRRWSSTTTPARRHPHRRRRVRAPRRVTASTRRTTPRLVFVKLLIGVGRARRGEVLGGGSSSGSGRCSASCARSAGGIAERSTTLRDTIDPVRRFERDFPEWGRASRRRSKDRSEDAAHALFDLTREILEPGGRSSRHAGSGCRWPLGSGGRVRSGADS